MATRVPAERIGIMSMSLTGVTVSPDMATSRAGWNRDDVPGSMSGAW